MRRRANDIEVQERPDELHRAGLQRAGRTAHSTEARVLASGSPKKQKDTLAAAFGTVRDKFVDDVGL